MSIMEYQAMEMDLIKCSSEFILRDTKCNVPII